MSNSSLRMGNSSESQCVNEDFYFEEKKNYCVPNCYAWKSYSAPATTAIDCTVALTSSIGFLVNLLVVIVSCIRHKSV